MIKKILVIDNSRAILTLMVDLLEKHGYEVKTAEDGLAALKVLETYQPDVIFIDLVMPKITGDKLCPIIRNMPELQGVYLVILSAIAAEQEIDFRGLGADACIAKGPYKDIEQDITSVLALFEQQNIDGISEQAVGVEKLYKRDITRELLSIQHHYAFALNNISDGFLELTPEATIVFANTAATEMLGTPELELLASSFPDLFKEDQRARIAQVLEDLGESSIGIGEFTPVVLNNKHLVMNFVPIIDQEKRSVVVVIHDITQRKLGEKQLAEYYKRLDDSAAERIEELQAVKAELEREISARKKAEQEKERLAAELEDAQAKVKY